ncbi:hypothetical protein GS575_07320, partial [Rhodococcus hoagii]|nr:hypothetical protein [Prescottella equi]
VEGPGVFQGFGKAPETPEEADAEHRQHLMSEDVIRRQIANEPSRQRYDKERAARDAFRPGPDHRGRRGQHRGPNSAGSG